MKNIKIVIGSNFGDEGKGLMTDYFASQCKNGVVVRFNGGSQAGHTVVTPEGIKHVFAHFGSGTFLNLPTYLSKYFIINPMLFKKEYEKLQKKKIIPKVYINENCFVTTPYDMIINQIIEKIRGNDRHGSCGIGVNETIRRSENDDFRLNIYDLKYKHLTAINLLNIQRNYLTQRLKDLGIVNIPIEFIDLIYNDNIIKNYFSDIEFMLNNSQLISDDKILHEYNDIIFEGAQGLLLDQNNMEYFPNLTPSNTGMQNVVETLKNNKLENNLIEICYVTRSYLTRHGSGRLDNELINKPYSKVIDLTNIPNDYQGKLRFSLLDIDTLGNAINKDLKFASDLKYKKSIAITCMDQVDNEELKYIKSNMIIQNKIDFFIRDLLAKKIWFDYHYESHGMTRATVSKTNINTNAEIDGMWICQYSTQELENS